MFGLQLDNQYSVESRLLDLFDLTVDEIWSVVLAGEAERDGVTANHPPTSPGFRAWDGSIARIRELLKPRGWTVLNANNLPLTVSPNGRALTATSGTPETGTAIPPRSQNPKGASTVNMVEVNRQFELFPNPSAPHATPGGREISECWWILRFRSGNVVRAEVSLPRGFDKARRIVSWIERIPLGQFYMLSGHQSSEPSEHSDGAIDISVTPL